MELVIDLDKIHDSSKQERLIKLLKEEHIDFETNERRQTIDEYNEDLERGAAEFERGEFITAEDLKKEMLKW